ncbi:MAG: hypothetical protein DRP03_00080 [Candidatus Aenigmatarchaeota archaeon]|nr:MAG: hypothetical protein DRP03_00080 [Candidatus Aenigmarchaeota archaeon]
MIFTIILIFTIMVFGGKQIMHILNFGGEAGVYLNVGELENKVEDIYSMSYNSADKLTIRVPEGTKICFLNPRNAKKPGVNWKADENYAFIAEMNNYNLMIIRSDGFDGKQIKHLLPSENFCLISTNDVMLINKGSYVDIEMIE